MACGEATGERGFEWLRRSNPRSPVASPQAISACLRHTITCQAGNSV